VPYQEVVVLLDLVVEVQEREVIPLATPTTEAVAEDDADDGRVRHPLHVHRELGVPMVLVVEVLQDKHGVACACENDT
jgi:hypothetical protein